ncbi:hypothetical protein RYZ27_10720 [Hyphomonas sp. FCG-A18]|jgi:surface antigen|uniref:hypothetical protein n=1 Tax=Hyphomonas sp. FCG-A18 TaxID=3080019 RepID=UPI002B2D2F6D|nr:hypothetical protein RYZ27_10720 [Hyphomonas sp. FCG-A18]
MKYLLIFAALSLSACITNSEFDQEQAFQKCKNIDQKTSRDRCLSEAVEDAKRDRQKVNDRLQQQHEDAERRELERAKAGVEQD